jgi:hypothetical protein
MIIILSLIWAVMSYFIFTAPAVSAILYGLLGADRDGYGVLQYLSIINDNHKVISRSIFIFLYLYCSLIVFRNIRNYNSFVKLMIYGIQILSSYIVLVSLIKGYDVLKSLSFLIYTGMPTYVIWIVASQRKSLQKQFKLFIFIQMLVAIGVLLIPAMSPLDGSAYKALEGVRVSSDTSLNTTIPDDESSINKGKINKYASFHNPNALGFYSCVAIGIGLMTFLNWKNQKSRVSAFTFLIMGFLGWLNSLTRGPMIAVIFAFLFVFVFFQNNSRFGKGINFLWAIGLLAIVFISSIFLPNNLLLFLTPDANDISVTARYDGYSYGLEALSRYPVFGVDDSWNWAEGSYPHLLPLSFAVDFGVFAGIAISFIVFLGGFWLIYTGFHQIVIQKKFSEHAALAITLLMITWGAALTNNLISPVLFWMCIAEATVIVFGVKSELNQNKQIFSIANYNHRKTVFKL